MKIAVLGNQQSWYVRELARAAGTSGHHCERIEFHRLNSIISCSSTVVNSGTTPLCNTDAVIVRTMPPGSLEQVVYRMDVLQRLEASGQLILNSPRAIECAVDKFLTTSRLGAVGLPVPRTIVCEAGDQALEAFHQLGGDVVVKPLFGAEGRGILRVSDEELADRAFRTLERLDSVLYLQEFIPHSGFDIRVLVLNGSIIGAIKRSNSRDFRTNVARQGIAQSHSATDQEIRLALQAAETVQACFAGVDLLYDPTGRCYVIEVNAVPGWKAFQAATGIDVATCVINELEKQLNDGPRR